MNPAPSTCAALPAPRPARWEELLALARKVGGEFEVRLHGQSMGEALPDGSEVRIAVSRNPGETACAPGVVALFWSPEGKRLVAHRVVRAGSNFQSRKYVITRGDACYLCDAPLNLDEVLGTVVSVRRDATWEAVPPPSRLSSGKRGIAGLTVLGTVGWAFCTTPALRRHFSLLMWRLRGSPQGHE